MAAFNQYSTRPARIPDEREGVLAIWEGSLSDRPHMERKFGWFYQQAPTGTPLTMLLEWRASENAEPVPIGVATAGRRQFRHGDRRLEAGVLVDMAVRAGHRTLGPALQLQKGLLAAGLDLASFLYGFPNPKAAAVFQRAGYSRVGSIQRYVRVLRASGYLGRVLPKTAARLLAPLADTGMHALVAAPAIASRSKPLQWLPLEYMPELTADDPSSAAPLLRGVRTREFLAWRFSGEHGDRFWFVGAPDRARTLYWVVEDQGEVLQIRDCAPQLMERSCRTHWRSLFREAQTRGYHSVSFECLAPDTLREVLTMVGMTVRSERPVFWATTPERADQFKGAMWYLTSADEDE